MIAQLDGFELPAGAWERAVLPARLDRYEPSMLDMLCLSGEVGWATPVAVASRDAAGRARPGDADRPVPARARGAVAGAARRPTHESAARSTEHARDRARRVLRSRGASFFARSCDRRAGSTPDQLAPCDRHARRLRPRSVGWIRRTACARVGGARPAGAHAIAARTSPDAGPPSPVDACRRRPRGSGRDARRWALLRRYGVVFRRLLDARDQRGAPGASWRASTVGSKRAGRFAAAGSSPACPASSSRCPTRSSGCAKSAALPPDGTLITISAADPLNLAGIVTAGDRIRAAGRTRIVYRDGAPLAVLEGEFVRELSPLDPATSGAVARALRTRRTPAQLV